MQFTYLNVMNIYSEYKFGLETIEHKAKKEKFTESNFLQQ